MYPGIVRQISFVWYWKCWTAQNSDKQHRAEEASAFFLAHDFIQSLYERYGFAVVTQKRIMKMLP